MIYERRRQCNIVHTIKYSSQTLSMGSYISIWSGHIKIYVARIDRQVTHIKIMLARMQFEKISDNASAHFSLKKTTMITAIVNDLRFNHYQSDCQWLTINCLPIGLYRDVWIAAIASSRTRLATLSGVMCNMSQCELRSLRVNSGMLNVIRIVTYYTLPPLESPTSSWIAMAYSR